MLHHREARERNAKQDGEGCGLGCCRHQSYDRRGRSLVNVWGPDVEGSCGDFEAEADKDESESGKGQSGSRCGLEAVGDGVEVGGPGCSKGKRDTVEKERGGEGAEQKVFDGRLGAGGLSFAKAAEDIGGDGRDLEAD